MSAPNPQTDSSVRPLTFMRRCKLQPLVTHDHVSVWSHREPFCRAGLHDMSGPSAQQDLESEIADVKGQVQAAEAARGLQSQEAFLWRLVSQSLQLLGSPLLSPKQQLNMTASAAPAAPDAGYGCCPCA